MRKFCIIIEGKNFSREMDITLVGITDPIFSESLEILIVEDQKAFVLLPANIAANHIYKLLITNEFQ